MIQTKKLKSIVSVLTGKQAVNQKLNINVNVYYDVLIIGEKVIIVIGGQLIKQNYFTVVMANRSAKLYSGSHRKLHSS